jgi:hypothetical protein
MSARKGEVMRLDERVLVEAGSGLAQITVEETVPGWEETDHPGIRLWQWDEYNTIIVERARIRELVDALLVFEGGSGDG